MFREQVGQFMQNIKQNIAEIIKLLWQFKWFVILDMAFFALLLSEYFNPPVIDDMIWGSEATHGAWNYQNQQLYIQSCKYRLVISALFFLIATSNMRNHPKLAKLIFLFPIFIGLMGLL